MTFNDTLKLAIAEYGGSIFPNRAAFLCHLFATNGTGYDWVNGELVSHTGTEDLNQLAQIEQYVGAGKHKIPNDDVEHIPEELFYYLFDFVIPPDIEEKLVNTEYNHWYPMSPGYNKLDCVPIDAKPDWINAAWECATLILINGIDLETELPRHLMSFNGDREKAVESVMKQYESNCAIARAAIENMKQNFPDHVFEQNPIPTFDSNRKMVKGVKPWPIEIDDHPYFESVVDPFVKVLRFAYALRRKNQNKDIPYDKEDQGRDALRVILAKVMQVGAELGRRDVISKLVPQLNSFLRRKEHDHEDEIKKATDPLYKLRSEILEKIRNPKHVGPFIDETDPVQIEQLAIVKENLKVAHEQMQKFMEEFQKTA